MVICSFLFALLSCTEVGQHAATYALHNVTWKVTLCWKEKCVLSEVHRQRGTDSTVAALTEKLVLGCFCSFKVFLPPLDHESYTLEEDSPPLNSKQQKASVLKNTARYLIPVPHFDVSLHIQTLTTYSGGSAFATSSKIVERYPSHMESKHCPVCASHRDVETPWFSNWRSRDPPMLHQHHLSALREMMHLSTSRETIESFWQRSIVLAPSLLFPLPSLTFPLGVNVR